MINLPTLYLECQNFTPFQHGLKPSSCNFILIFMIFSKKESLVPQYITSDSYLHPKGGILTCLNVRGHAII